MEEAEFEESWGRKEGKEFDGQRMGGGVGRPFLTKTMAGLRHEGRGEIRLMYFNKEVEIKKRLQVNL